MLINIWEHRNFNSYVEIREGQSRKQSDKKEELAMTERMFAMVGRKMAGTQAEGRDRASPKDT
jgi:hypothetical protein